MKADDLKINELINFSEDSLNLKGRRLAIHDVHAFALFRKDLIDSIGVENTRKILTRFGYFWGQADAAAMQRIFKWGDIKEWIMSASKLLAFQGSARTQIKIVKLDTENKIFHLDFLWYNSCEVEGHTTEIGKVDYPVCWILTGYASGFVSYCLQQNIYFVERKCRGKGDRVCCATGMDETSWGDELKQFHNYFEHEDIIGKVKFYTEELKKRNKELEQERKKLKLLGGNLTKNDFIEVRSKAFQDVMEVAQRVARFDTSVLIKGESGTGKEVLSRFIYKHSERANNICVAINCSALPETLLEGELFGYKAGAFTGASHDRIGLFEQADKGTVFLDEIGDVSPATQVKLLRVLQEKEILRLGENRPRKIDVRIIAATNRDLKADVLSGRFREDLYYRLSVVEIDVPPLRTRKDDILPLARHFVNKFSKKMKIHDLRLDVSCIDYLLSYDWPGNVRELENAMERASVFSNKGLITIDCLPQSIVQNKVNPNQNYSVNMKLAQLESAHINSVLKMTEGNRTKAAEILGISPVTLWRKLSGNKIV